MPDRRVQFTRPEAQRVTIESSAEQQSRPVSQLRGAVVGGGARGPTPVAPNVNRDAARFDSSTLDALQAMGDAIIRPAVERRQQEMFLEGARRQIEGEALADVVRDQPWYSKIFGPSATVQGARTLAQITEVEAFSTQLHQDLPQLRSLSPDEFQKELMHRIRSTSVGDATADAAVQAQLMENFGPIIRNHTKEHVSWVQEQMQEQFTSALMASSRTYYMGVQGLVTGHMSDEDFRAAQMSAAAGLQPLEGQTPESYWASIEAATVEAAALGNFHFVNLVQETLYEHMPADMRVKFLDERRKRENQTISDLSAGEYSLMIANVKSYSAEGLVDAQSTWNNILEVNRRFSAQTGIQRDLIDHSAAEGIITNNIRGIVKEQKAANERARTAAEKEQAEFNERLAARLALATGQLGSYVAQGGNRGLAQTEAAALVEEMREQGQDWALLLSEQVNADGTVVQDVRNRIRYGVNASIGGEYNPAFEESYQDWLAIFNSPGGAVAAAAYAGDEYHGKLYNYHTQRQAGGGDPVGPFDRNFSRPTTLRQGSRETRAEIAEVLRPEAQPGWWARTFGATPLHPVTADLLGSAAASHADTMDLPIGQAGIAEVAVGLARQEIDVIGPYGYYRTPGTPSVANFMGTDATTAGMIYQRVMDNKLKAVGVKDPMDEKFIITRGGTKDYPHWTARIETGERAGAVVTLTGQELLEEFEATIRHGGTRVEFSRDNIPGTLLP